MIVGSLGSIVFQVSSNTIETINSFQWSGAARYATHQRHGVSDLIEFTGIDAEKITFDIELSAYLGVSPQTELDKLKRLMKSGTAVPLVFGSRVFGQFRWCLSGMKVKSHFDREGAIERATVSITLQEYLNS